MSQNANKLKWFVIQILSKDGFSSHFVSHWISVSLDLSSNRCSDGLYESRGKKEERKSKP